MPEPEPTPAPTPQPAPPKQSFSYEYVHELREESKANRVARLESEQRAKEATEAAARAKEEAATEAAAKIAEATQKANDRIVRAELKALAVKEGIIDLDGLKLVDIAAVTLDENGEVKGAEELIKALKEGKPYLFGAPHTSNPEPKPKPNDPKPKNAMEMSKEEFEAAEKELTRVKR